MVDDPVGALNDVLNEGLPATVPHANVLDPCGLHYQAVGADHAVEPQAEVIGSTSIMGVHQHDLRHGACPGTLGHGCMPEAQHVLREVTLALDAGSALLGADGKKALLHEARDHMHGRKEAVTFTGAMPGLLGEHGRG